MCFLPSCMSSCGCVQIIQEYNSNFNLMAPMAGFQTNINRTLLMHSSLRMKEAQSRVGTIAPCTHCGTHVHTVSHTCTHCSTHLYTLHHTCTHCRANLYTLHHTPVHIAAQTYTHCITHLYALQHTPVHTASHTCTHCITHLYTLHHTPVHIAVHTCTHCITHPYTAQHTHCHSQLTCGHTEYTLGPNWCIHFHTPHTLSHLAWYWACTLSHLTQTFAVGCGLLPVH